MFHAVLHARQVASLEPPRSVARCTLARDFAVDLLAGLQVDAAKPGQVVMNVDHLQHCLQQLSMASAARERERFLAFNQMYRTVVGRLQDKLLAKNQDLHDMQLSQERTTLQRHHEADCTLADKAEGLLHEVTALRSQVAYLSRRLHQQASSKRPRSERRREGG